MCAFFGNYDDYLNSVQLRRALCGGGREGRVGLVSCTRENALIYHQPAGWGSEDIASGLPEALMVFEGQVRLRIIVGVFRLLEYFLSQRSTSTKPNMIPKIPSKSHVRGKKICLKDINQVTIRLEYLV